MPRRRGNRIAGAAALSAAVAFVGVYHWQAPQWAASALLHPSRRLPSGPPARPHDALSLHVNGVTLAGWRFPAQGPRRSTLVYLHGVGDNRAGSVGIAERFTRLGFDVVAYDSRAHGESTGEACTYGFFEREDLKAIVRQLPQQPVVLMGHSLGAAVALQTAAETPVAAVIAAETFSDLRTVAGERAPRILTPGVVRLAFDLAEARGRFRVDEVSPVRAAARITAPVFLIHGADDIATRPSHSQRVYESLKGPRQMLLVAGAGHSRSLTSEALDAVEAWLRELGLVRPTVS